jgi:hypothetical protein
MTPAEFNQKELEEGRLTWSMITELVKHWQASHSLEADGICGPVTQATLAPRSEKPTPTKPPSSWKPWDGPLTTQPRSRSDIYTMFGNPGTGTPDPTWEKKNIVTLRDLPGVPTKWYFQIHKAIEPYLREAFRRAQLSCPDYKIERAAGYVFRHTRHDPSLPLSYHSFGIAVDVDPQWNQAKYFEAGRVPEAWSPEWMKVWPKGLPKEFVQAFASCGFAWGSDWDEDGSAKDHTFQDPMHFEWVARDGKNTLV